MPLTQAALEYQAVHDNIIKRLDAIRTKLYEHGRKFEQSGSQHVGFVSELKEIDTILEDVAERGLKL